MPRISAIPGGQRKPNFRKLLGSCSSSTGGVGTYCQGTAWPVPMCTQQAFTFLPQLAIEPGLQIQIQTKEPTKSNMTTCNAASVSRIRRFPDHAMSRRNRPTCGAHFIASAMKLNLALIAPSLFRTHVIRKAAGPEPSNYIV